MSKRTSNLILFSLITIIVGIFFSRALMSIGNILLVLIALLHGKKTLKSKWEYSEIIFFAIFFLQALSLTITENLQEGIRDIINKLPFLGIPFAFAVLRKYFTRSHLVIVLHLFILFAFISSVLTIGNFLLHYDEIAPKIIHSKPIPIIPEMEHIYFSTLVALGILFSFFIYFRFPDYALTRVPRKLYLVTGIWMTINLFLSTSRTGIFVLILTMFFEGIRYVLQKKKYKIIVAGLLIFITLGYGFSLLPPIKSRLKNTQMDLKAYFTGEDIADWSLSKRLAAMETSWYVLKKHPLLGIGTGDMTTEFKEYFHKMHFTMYRKVFITPHNQFLEFAVASGVLTAILLFIFFIKYYLEGTLLMRITSLAIFFALQAELMLERQRGISFILLLLFLLRTEINKRKKELESKALS